MNKNIYALILAFLGLALLSVLQGGILGWSALGICGACSFVMMFLEDHDKEKRESAQKIEALEKRVKELEDNP